MNDQNWWQHKHGINPNPHNHEIEPNPHTHDITPNPHRHGMRFAESGSFVDFGLENNCRVGPEILVNLIYTSLNEETAKEKSRVSEAAKKGNWITANKLGRPIWDYLENYYIRRVICYLQSRVWYTEYETLTNVPTTLTVVPTALYIDELGRQTTTARQQTTNPIISTGGTTVSSSISPTPSPTQSPTPSPTPSPTSPQNKTFTRCRPPGGPCVYYETTSCGNVGIPGTFTPC